MMTSARRVLIALVVGAVLVWAVPVAIALVAAAPGLRTLIVAIQASGLPRPETYFGLTSFLPALLFSFAIGCAMFRALGGSTRALLVASAAPWVLNAIYVYVDLCLGSEVSCIGPYDMTGLTVVPIGLLLAALVSRQPRWDTSGDRDRRQQAAVPHARGATRRG